jgi:hypothetical protein
LLPAKKNLGLFKDFSKKSSNSGSGPKFPNAKHIIDQINTMQQQLLHMNAGIERAMNSKNLGTRIMENGSLDRKIWGLKAFRGKIIFLGGSGAILEFL